MYRVKELYYGTSDEIVRRSAADDFIRGSLVSEILPQWKSLCVWTLHSLVCIPTGRRMHKHQSCLTVLSVGGGHDRPARVSTTKWWVFLENVTTLSHNLCGAVMTAPYRQRVISFPFPEKSNHTSFFIEPISFLPPALSELFRASLKRRLSGSISGRRSFFHQMEVENFGIFNTWKLAGNVLLYSQ